jgi:glycerol-3-phosphate acyltransferase PlsY
MGWLPLLAAFLLGSIPSAVLVGRLAGVDPSGQGSGNPGATNTWRSISPLAGLLVLALDVFKGWAAVAWVPPIAPNHPSWFPAAVAAAAVLGHVFNPFLLLRGGKGVATSAGVLGALAPPLLIVPLTLFAIVFAIRRRVSEASLVAALSLPLASGVWRLVASNGWPGGDVLILTGGLALLLIWTHRENIARIRSGDEPPLLR